MAEHNFAYFSYNYWTIAKLERLLQIYTAQVFRRETLHPHSHLNTMNRIRRIYKHTRGDKIADASRIGDFSIGIPVVEPEVKMHPLMYVRTYILTNLVWPGSNHLKSFILEKHIDYEYYGFESSKFQIPHPRP